MKEYKVVTGMDSECQKWLNQWKHEFELEILAMISRTASTITILLTREKK